MDTIQISHAHGDYGTEATDEYGHSIKIDSSPQIGGLNFGTRPMKTLLMGLGGCSIIDVVSILKKQRQNVVDYKITVSGEREQNKEPSLWKSVSMEFHLYGDIDADKAARAVDLSVNKYCSVAATLKAAGAEIKTSVFVHAVE